MDNKTNPEGIRSSFWANFFNTPTEKVDLQKSLKAIPIFKYLSNKDISQLMEIIHNRNYLAGEYVFYQGDPGIGLYIIRDGEVVVQRNSEDNSILPLATFSKGDFFGELALIDGEKRSASAITKIDSRLAVIFKPDLDEFIDKFPKKGIKILLGISEIVAMRLRKLNEDHFQLQSKSNIKSENDYGT